MDYRSHLSRHWRAPQPHQEAVRCTPLARKAGQRLRPEVKHLRAAKHRQDAEKAVFNHAATSDMLARKAEQRWRPEVHYLHTTACGSTYPVTRGAGAAGGGASRELVKAGQRLRQAPK
jgi:hypothetical protein